MITEQKALDIQYNKMTGQLNLDELNRYLSEGFTVATTEASAGGDLLVVVQKSDPPFNPYAI